MARHATIVTVLLLVALTVTVPASVDTAIGINTSSSAVETGPLQAGIDDVDGDGSDDAMVGQNGSDDGMDDGAETDNNMTETDTGGDEMTETEATDSDGMGDDEMADSDGDMTETEEAEDGTSSDEMDDGMTESMDEDGFVSIGQAGFGVLLGGLAIALAAGLLAWSRR